MTRTRTPTLATASLALFLSACSPAGEETGVAVDPEPAVPANAEESGLVDRNLDTAESFIDAFYSFDPDRLGAFLQSADESAEGILYYQGWAKGGNYIVVERSACEAESATLVRCPVTVQDDPVVALNTGFNVTDTFHLTFEGGNIVAVETSSNDQPIYYEARKWVEANMPEIMDGPCNNRGKASGTPIECARAMTAGYQAFYAAVYADEG